MVANVQCIKCRKAITLNHQIKAYIILNVIKRYNYLRPHFKKKMQQLNVQMENKMLIIFSRAYCESNGQVIITVLLTAVERSHPPLDLSRNRENGKIQRQFGD